MGGGPGPPRWVAGASAGVCVEGGGQGKAKGTPESAGSTRGGRARLPYSGPTSTPQQPRLAAPTVPVVEAAALAAALPSPHTDNMAAAEEETHGSAASRRDQSEAAPATAGSGNPLYQEMGRDGFRPRPQRGSRRVPPCWDVLLYPGVHFRTRVQNIRSSQGEA